MYMSARHQEGLAHLLYGIDFGGGFVALTGEVGTGKTTLCHCLLQQLPKNIEVALILNSRLNVIELVATICDELGIIYDKAHYSLKSLIDLLNQYLLTAHASGKRTVLLIDEAQNLSLDVLEQVRLLTNLETSKTKLLRIILVGQPELKILLARQDLRQLNQRITARYHLLPLSLNETRAYIRHRLIVSNGQPDIFKDSAIRKIYKLTSGIPRLINILCDRSLLGAYSTNSFSVTPAIVNHAAEEVLAINNKKKTYINVLLGLLLVSVAAITGFYFFKNPSSPNHIVDDTLQVADSIIVIRPQFMVPDKAPYDLKPIINNINSNLPGKVQSFYDWINNPELSLDAALRDSYIAWGKVVPEHNKVDCRSLDAMGLRCVFGKANWKDILALNRPAVLEFSLADKRKYHALLTGFGQNQSIIYFKDDKIFPVADVLKYWDGYYLMLDAPPSPNENLISYPQTSDQVLWLRYVLNSIDGKSSQVDQPRYFDKELSARVLGFQRQHQLTPDGKVGVKTLEILKTIARGLETPHLKIRD
jgi:general secretion pathway protein A